MQSISSLSNLLKTRQGDRQALFQHAASARICSVFNDLLKEKNPAMHQDGIQAIAFKDGVLTVKANTHAQGQALFLEELILINDLNEKLTSDVVKQIKIKF